MVLHYVGAYNVTQSMQFIALRPNVVLIDMQGHVHVARKKDTLDTLERNEVLPDYLSSFKL